jgi:4-hydroxy-4-methyl-2-oxoglutarate aldolase
MIGVVVRRKPTFSAEVAGRLAALGCATTHEAQGRTGLLQPILRPVVVHVAIEQCSPGDVLVVACMSDCTDGMVGELLATSMRARGVAGLVIDAGCRDVEAIRSMRFPVWAKVTSARGTVKASLGSVNVPVICSGALVTPGDAIVADDDGIAVVPFGHIDRVIRAGEERVTREARKRARLAKGELGLDIDNMRPRLEELGLRYVDSLDDLD